MSKKNKKTQSRCDEHVFQLKPLYNQSKLPQKTCVSFCEGGKNKKTKKPSRNHSSQCLSYPIYNSDHNHATPSFILQEDKWHYEEQGPRLREQHDMKMESYLQQKESLVFLLISNSLEHSQTPNQNKPLQRLPPALRRLLDQHIQSQAHLQKSKHNIYTRYIEQLAYKFFVNSKNKHNLYSSHHTLTTQGEDEKELPQCLPKKKIKCDENQHIENLQHRNLQPSHQQPMNDLVEENNRVQFQVPPQQQNNVTNNRNFWYSHCFYPILYPFNYQLPYQNQNQPPSYYYLDPNYQNQFYQNYNNFPTITLNQPTYLENQNPNVPLNTPQEFQLQNNLFFNQ